MRDQMICKDRDMSDAAMLQVENRCRSIRVSLMATETIMRPVQGEEKVLMVVNGILRDF